MGSHGLRGAHLDGGSDQSDEPEAQGGYGSLRTPYGQTGVSIYDLKAGCPSGRNGLAVAG